MLDLARVTAARPGSHAVDIEFLRDGRRVAGVQCMTPFGGTDFGSSGLVSPQEEGFGKNNNGSRDVFAVVAFLNDHPLVLGFLFPQVCQVLFDELGRMVYRHPSDVYLTIDAEGNTELAHPSGAFIRLGGSPGHEDLTGKDFDGVWKISRNTDKAVHIHVEQAGGKASVDIAPSGKVEAKSVESITLDAPMLYLKGTVEQTGGPSTWAQTMTVETDVIGGGKSLVNHAHNEQGDGAPTSPPI